MSPMKGRISGMPPTGGRLGINQSRYVKAQLTRSYQKGGRHYIDAHLAKGAGGWTGIPVIEAGGGVGRYMHIPIAGDQGEGKPAFSPAEESDPTDIASAQVWLFFDGSSNFPVCVGAVQHSKRGLVTDTPTTGEDEDRPDDIGVNDFAMVNGEASFVVDSEGVIAASPRAGKPVNMKFPTSSSWLRLSRDGKARERVPLGRKMTRHLRDAQAVRRSLEQRIAALETAMTTVVAALNAGIPVAAGSTVPTTIVFTPAVAQAEPADPDDTMLASVARISEDEEAAGVVVLT